ncbi:MAG TPA: alpha/beta hydrolase [Pyrinomonadaceae bacterium]|nr:alpha/beta hydrolase [Pyrinomonadaceae bacterium]
MSQVVESSARSRSAFEDIYRDVPREQRELLTRFRATHAERRLDLDGVEWSYYASGPEGGPALLLLPGAIGKAEVAFRHILEFESDYRVIAPDYPLVPTVKRLLDGLVLLLDAERVESVIIIGGSVGGGLAQCMVREYPERVSHLILSHTGVPNPQRAKLSGLGMAVMRLLPISWFRAGLRWEISSLLSSAGDEKEFWRAYFRELVQGLNKEQLVSGYERAIDLEQHYTFTSHDLKDWPGRILILESDNDTIIKAAERARLKALYPQAQTHTFIGAGHGASIVRREEYTQVVRSFLSAVAA